MQLSRSRQSSRNLDDSTIGVVFFGTPLAIQKTNDMKKTFRKCATVELGLIQTELQDPNERDMQDIMELLKSIELASFSIIAAFETVETLIKTKKRRMHSDKKKIVSLPSSAHSQG